MIARDPVGGSVSRELRPPFEESTDETSRYGPLFWGALAVGGAAMAFGLWSLLSRAEATRPGEVAVYVVGLALVHDMLIAPAAIVVATMLRAVIPRASRGILLGAVTVSVIVVAFATPMLAGWGAQPDNPSFLPRDYVAGVAVVLAGIWGVAIGVALVRGRRRR